MNEQKQTHYLSAAARKTRKYYAFEYVGTEKTTCADNPKMACGQGYVFSSAKDRDFWVAFLYSPTGEFRFRKALTRDEARIKSKYGAFIEIEKED